MSEIRDFAVTEINTDSCLNPGALDEVEWLRSRLEILESSLLASSSDGRLLNRC